MKRILNRRHLIIAALTLLAGVMVLPDISANAGSSSHVTGITVEGAFARATIGAGKTGVAYLTVHNSSGQADRLVGTITEISKRASLHTHLHENGVMKMRPIDGIVIPAHGMAELKPGGDHVMLMGLKAPLKMGDHFPLALVFEKAGEIPIMVTVGPVGAKSAGHGTHKKN
jgi:periplasmic copper chaperone A